MNLSERERRTIRLGSWGLAVYLALFGLVQVWRGLEARRAAYQELVAEARQAAARVTAAENRVLKAGKLKEGFGFEPRKLVRGSLVADASAAIQQAAQMGGVQVLTLRESAARRSAREMATMQFDGMGPVPGVLGLLHRLGTLGYPLVVDAVQMQANAMQPGMIKFSLTIILLDFESWQGKEGPRG